VQLLQILTPRPERLRARVLRTHLRHDYLLCQIVCLSIVFNECVLRARCWRCFYGSAPGNRFSWLRVTELLHLRASFAATFFESQYCVVRLLFYLSYIYNLLSCPPYVGRWQSDFRFGFLRSVLFWKEAPTCRSLYTRHSLFTSDQIVLVYQHLDCENYLVSFVGLKIGHESVVVARS
jgi:hypothetical protein